jgi:4-amino-4-deoxy-L-arabinose transferase-like glycosyltransferase
MITSIPRPTLLLGCLLTLYVAFAAVLIPRGVDDIQMAAVYSADESGAAAEVSYYHRTGRLDKASFTYGSLFYYVPLVILELVGWVTPVSGKIILVVLRIVCTVSGIGVLLLTYRLAIRLFDNRVGLIACVLLACSPTFLRWSIESHPDLPQLFWILCFLVTAVRIPDRLDLKRVIVASAFAALAFNTKYIGLFLLPVLALAIVVSGQSDGWRARLTETRRWAHLGVAVGTFIIVFGLTNPFAILQLDAFQRSLQAEREIMAFGHTFLTSSSVTDWVAMSGSMIGWWTLLPLGLYAVFEAKHLLERGAFPRPGVTLLLTWCLFLLSYLAVFSSVRYQRHLLPILPAMTVFCGAAYVWLWSQARGLTSTKARVRWVVVPLFLLSLQPSVVDGTRLVSERMQRGNAEQDEIRAGTWLADNYAADTSILYGAYSYVPGKFKRVELTPGLSYFEVEHFRPDLIVIRDAAVSDYEDPNRAAESRIGKTAYLDRHDFYQYLRSGELPSYTEVRTFGTVTVYARTDSLSGSDLPWPELASIYRSGRRLGVDQAMEVMEQIRARHRVELQQREIQKYNEAMTLLTARNPEKAEAVFGELLTMVESFSDSHRAAIHQHISRAYFESGYYELAADAARSGVELRDPFDEGHFELGAFLIAAGQSAEADAVLAEAVHRFGPSDFARSLLGHLVDRDIAREAAQRALALYFSDGIR